MAQPRNPNEPMSDEQILAATVGERRVHGGPVNLAEYDRTWPEAYARHEERIAAALGERALRIEHVGSTSVPGLAAKPTIDICWSWRALPTSRPISLRWRPQVTSSASEIQTPRDG
jgi:GrpB-like predicted nucleotidyltransferase (UPF0157 family)